ncbi:hypothetical protein [Micromonospora sp. NPDC048839]|uniref:hypothetical protein n=1 Tax=Micromonospora sp. NPDC048839 TaxID=3155641 RepID=UPI0033E937CD
MPECLAAYAFYQQQYELLATEMNKEADYDNLLIYAHLTPLYKLLLNKALRKPLPHKARGHPTEMENPAEGALLKVHQQDEDNASPSP